MVRRYSGAKAPPVMSFRLTLFVAAHVASTAIAAKHVVKILFMLSMIEWFLFSTAKLHTFFVTSKS